MLSRATTRTNQTGHRPNDSWYEQYHHRAVQREALTAAATAGGIPRVWIDQVRARGDRGTRWRPDLHLRTPEPLDWDAILTDLATDVNRLHEWSALDAAHHPTSAEATDAAAFADNMHALRARTVGLSNLLALTGEDGRQLWGTEQDWIDTSAAMLDNLPAEIVSHRWRAAAATDTSSYALQAEALAAAGISVETTDALPTVHGLRSGISAAVSTPHTLFQPAITGTDIDTAITAANLTFNSDTEIGQPVFSHATIPWPGPDHSIEDGPEP